VSRRTLSQGAGLGDAACATEAEEGVGGFDVGGSGSAGGGDGGGVRGVGEIGFEIEGRLGGIGGGGFAFVRGVDGNKLTYMLLSGSSCVKVSAVGSSVTASTISTSLLFEVVGEGKEDNEEAGTA
jgi:hypothetical protein